MQNQITRCVHHIVLCTGIIIIVVLVVSIIVAQSIAANGDASCFVQTVHELDFGDVLKAVANAILNTPQLSSPSCFLTGS